MTDQRVLWVTGGGSGMGAAGAEAAARDGWTVVLSGRRAGPTRAGRRRHPGKRRDRGRPAPRRERPRSRGRRT
ncbi:hypothetical protein Q9Q99_14560 [Curtobacterium flaccumfaciens]|nr:hypothetical protein Q9Q99_14560 [Curtobacterium flaccumfaciens]